MKEERGGGGGGGMGRERGPESEAFFIKKGTKRQERTHLPVSCGCGNCVSVCGMGSV